MSNYHKEQSKFIKIRFYATVFGLEIKEYVINIIYHEEIE
jgi:hypothetical protein